jgi:hypothetical protein
LKENGEAISALEVNEKFIPVKILEVVEGCTDGPEKLSFEYTPSRRFQVNLKLYGTNTSDGILGKAFSESYTFDDPHEFYPSISNDNWRLIQVN